MLRSIFLFLTISLTALGQDPDTLLFNLLKLENDTEKVNQLYKQGFSLRNTNPQLAYLYAKHSEKEALECVSQKHLAKSYNLLGILYYKKGQYKTSVNYHRHALQLRTDINDVLGIAQSQQNLGNVYSEIKMMDKAEKAYLGAMNAYYKIGLTEKAQECLNNMGVIRHALKEYDAAIENYKMALTMCNENDYDAKARYMSNMGEAYLGKHDTLKAIALNLDALKLRSMCENDMEAGDNYVNLAGIFIVTKEFDKAKRYLQIADSIANLYDYFDLKLNVYKISAFYHQAAGNAKEGFELLENYYHKRDSLLAAQQMATLQYDFEENFSEPIKVKASLKDISNKWMAILLVLILTFISYSIFKNKR